jgi:mannose-6-phosphate isomerase-like protein (cupin superfamily)/pyrroloquinoline quinone (PQQ) biosynthesis protein C
MPSPQRSTALDPALFVQVPRPATAADASDGEARPAAALARLRAEVEQHPIWSCRLLRACELGHLSRDDYRYLFSQYAHYSRNFTRYLAALMARCDSDYFRAVLSENLWEEGGMQRPEQRHSQIFREFLSDALGISLADARCDPPALLFVERYLNYCLTAPVASAAAFLALGTEGIVPRLYAILTTGLRQIGLDDRDLHFFLIHMACDDAHAATLNDLTASYATQPGWEQLVREGARAALDLRLQFFDALFEAIQQERLRATLAHIQDRESLAATPAIAEEVVFSPRDAGIALYNNRDERLNIEFAVTRVPFSGDTLDPRVVRIPPGRCNERHKHAHESFFYVVSGRGRVRVGDSLFEVRAGDMAFVPRWALHQTENTGTEEMLIVAVTDYNLAAKAYVGEYYDSAHRMKRDR